jgi:hypothetical protein
MDFIAGDGVTLIVSGNGQTQTGFFYEITCSVDVNGNVVIPVFTIQSTTDGNLPTALFIGQLFDNDAPREIIFGFQNTGQGWSIPTQLGTNVALSDLWRYNQATVLFYPPNTYPTYSQMVEYVNLHGGSGFSGSTGYSGFSGVSGYSGFSGYSAYSGFSGDSGISGFSGYSGFTGYSGFSGVATSGFSGFTGSSGFSGFSGTPGSAVASGYSGFSGPSGFSGFSGANPGASGFSGFSGKSGYSGYSGVGTSGFSGYSGSGVSGYSGAGTSGFSGFSGKSGYSGFSSSSGFSGFSGVSGFSGGGGAGSVTVVGSGNLTSTAIVTGGGAQTLQTASVTSTLSSGGSMVLAGTLTTGSGGGTGVVALTPGTFASLPASPTKGMIAAITNSTVNTFGATVAGGGSNSVLAWYNGSAWTCIGV